jgi:hypothetical protein
MLIKARFTTPPSVGLLRDATPEVVASFVAGVSGGVGCGCGVGPVATTGATTGSATGVALGGVGWETAIGFGVADEATGPESANS